VRNPAQSSLTPISSVGLTSAAAARNNSTQTSTFQRSARAAPARMRQGSHTASQIFPADIFDWPSRRSSKTIGCSAMRQHARLSPYFISTRKAYPSETLSSSASFSSASRRRQRNPEVAS